MSKKEKLLSIIIFIGIIAIIIILGIILYFTARTYILGYIKDTNNLLERNKRPGIIGDVYDEVYKNGIKIKRSVSTGCFGGGETIELMNFPKPILLEKRSWQY